MTKGTHTTGTHYRYTWPSTDDETNQSAAMTKVTLTTGTHYRYTWPPMDDETNQSAPLDCAVFNVPSNTV